MCVCVCVCVSLLHLFAGGEDILHQRHIIEHQRQPEGFWVTVELAEDIESALEQRRALWLRDITHTAAEGGREGEREREREGENEGERTDRCRENISNDKWS